MYSFDWKTRVRNEECTAPFNVRVDQTIRSNRTIGSTCDCWVYCRLAQREIWEVRERETITAKGQQSAIFHQTSTVILFEQDATLGNRYCTFNNINYGIRHPLKPTRTCLPPHCLHLLLLSSTSGWITDECHGLTSGVFPYQKVLPINFPITFI